MERFPQFTIGTKDDAFLAEKARGKAEFRVDLSDIPLTHRRERIEVSAGIANECCRQFGSLSCASDRSYRRHSGDGGGLDPDGGSPGREPF